MQINKDNFTSAKYDVFSLFNDHWGLATAGTPDDYNTMTIGWGTMGTIWGPPKGGKQIIEVFLRENRCTADVLLRNDYFTVCFFPEEKRKDLGILGSKSGWDVPDKIELTSLTPKSLGNAVGFEEATLTFVCKKIYAHKMLHEEVPEDVRNTMYANGNPKKGYVLDFQIDEVHFQRVMTPLLDCTLGDYYKANLAAKSRQYIHLSALERLCQESEAYFWLNKWGAPLKLPANKK